MKKIYFLVLALGLFMNAHAQVITFADADFKAKLLSASTSNSIAKNLTGSYFKIDSNSDNEIQVSEALQVSELYVNSDDAHISNVSGIQYFTNIHTLTCNNTVMTTLDVSSLANLINLECNANEQLVTLNANGLTNLKILDCSYNQLSSLNINNSTNIEELSCWNNHLTGLNVSGMVHLQKLYCQNNLIPVLAIDNLTTLKDLDCSTNQITSLNVANLVNLTYLYCMSNQISTINVSNLSNLVQFGCSYNQLASLNFAGLLNLEVLQCDGNPLHTIDVSGLTHLTALSCSENQLTSLDLTGLIQMEQLFFSYNQITSIDLSHLTQLQYLECTNNLLSTLDISNAAFIQELHCSDNSLVTLFLKNGVNENQYNYLHFNNNPSLQYICADESQIAAIEAQLVQYGNTNCLVNTYCTFEPGGTIYTINGNTRFDTNGNGCDVSDASSHGLKFAITNGTVSGNIIPDASGNYSMSVQSGSHTLTPILENPAYFTVSPASSTITFPTQSSPFTQDFCITANGVHPDLEVSVLQIIAARPGFDAVYKLIYKNKGNATQSGSVNLAFDDAVLDFVSSNQVVANQTVNNLSWDFSNLLPFETREITVTLNVNSPMETPAVNNGDILPYTANITSLATDDLPNDNTFEFNQTVVNSLDPNDKTCLEGATLSPAKVGEYVHYMIRFENTGTFAAQNIVVKDMIDTAKFDVSSIVPMKGSHSFVTNITSGNKVEFIFENINLPFDDANNDGYVAFKIKTKPTLSNGDTFSNTASIYFDYNFPIVTNTATTTIAALAVKDFEFSNYFNVYPNPVHDVLHISAKETIEMTSINIYNTLGQLVLVIPNAKEVKAVDVSNLTPGNYFIKIHSDKGTSNTKFIRN